MRVRDQDQRPVTAAVTDQSQADAGVAGGALDHEAARLDEPAPLTVENDVFRGTILDRAAGIEKLRLAEDRAARQFRGLPQFDQWRVADRVDEVFANIHVILVIVVGGGCAPYCTREDIVGIRPTCPCVNYPASYLANYLG